MKFKLDDVFAWAAILLLLVFIFLTGWFFTI